MVDHAVSTVRRHTGIGTIEAAQAWAESPEEGVGHEGLEDAYPREVDDAEAAGQERPA